MAIQDTGSLTVWNMRSIRVALGVSSLVSVLWCSGIIPGVAQCVALHHMTLEYSRLFPLEDVAHLALSGEEMCGMCEFVNGQTELLEEWHLQWSPEVMLAFFFIMLPVMRPVASRIRFLREGSRPPPHFYWMTDPPVPKRMH